MNPNDELFQDLFLRYKFTDRAGRDVYEIFASSDNKRQAHPLGTIRMFPKDARTGLENATVLWVHPPDPADDKAPVQLELKLEGSEINGGLK